MDASRTDAESGALHKHPRISKLKLLVAVQNLLLTACLFGTFYVYWTAKEFPEDVHIQFSPIAEVFRNQMLEFPFIDSKNQMELSDKSWIHIQCTGPYVLYMYVCYKSVEEESMGNGTLALKVVGSKGPRHTFKLQTWKEVCEGLHHIAYLSKKEKVTLDLISSDNFMMKNATVGFNYLLGSRCEF